MSPVISLFGCGFALCRSVSCKTPIINARKTQSRRGSSREGGALLLCEHWRCSDRISCPGWKLLFPGAGQPYHTDPPT
uniref:Putative secreted protein n=1 Tax=Anopheles darlingi TaxID=43151 RepID=A0A2M4D6P6_ANODA